MTDKINKHIWIVIKNAKKDYVKAKLVSKEMMKSCIQTYLVKCEFSFESPVVSCLLYSRVKLRYQTSI